MAFARTFMPALHLNGLGGRSSRETSGADNSECVRSESRQPVTTGATVGRPGGLVGHPPFSPNAMVLAHTSRGGPIGPGPGVPLHYRSPRADTKQATL